MARQRHAHDLGRAFGDHVAALVAPQALDRQVGGQPDTAVHLQAHVGGLPGHLGAEELHHVGFVAVAVAAVVARGGAMHEQRRGLERHIDVDQGNEIAWRLAIGCPKVTRCLA